MGGRENFLDERYPHLAASKPEIERKQTIGCFNQNTESNFSAKTLNMNVTKKFSEFYIYTASHWHNWILRAESPKS